jgi:hypothetical protein
VAKNLLASLAIGDAMQQKYFGCLDERYATCKEEISGRGRAKAERSRRMDRSNDSNDTPIDICGDLNQFFLEIIESVRQRRAYVTTSAAETYIAGLLADHASYACAMEDDEKPITLQLASALTLVGMERFERLRRVGDRVLYTTGFFGEHLESRGIAQTYMEELGARAYGSAGRMLLLDRREQNGLFVELAERFHMFVNWVHEVAELLRVGAARTESALVALYERWLASGSEALAAALALNGVVPLRGNGTLQ